MQVVEEPTRRGVLLNLVLTKKEGQVGDVKAGGSLGCSDREMAGNSTERGLTQVFVEKKSSPALVLQDKIE
ncbi:mast stem cell growth factor receptor kit [Limosa lapponica baueri]|uniref:Mast stem cell growth factor receptor kit n=1 Tax=Limosa lapponica baueri TaxID=1758121 RepID=A0A2I0TV03_LIMLA|nr:mast stem cell growth factor receptor kit [Limosa lapponica baueri]